MRNVTPSSGSAQSIMGRVEKHSLRQSRPSRSRPISCVFCRTRKLRCSRQFPCNNCTSRGLNCHQEGEPASSVSSSNEISPEPAGFQQNVLSRLEKLEEIVASKQKHVAQDPSFHPRAWQKGYPESHTEISSTIDVDWLEGEVTYPASAVSFFVRWFWGTC